MTFTLVTDEHILQHEVGRWVNCWHEETQQWVWVQVPIDWKVLPGWPGWAKLFPKNFTGLCDPFKKRLWRRSGTAWGLKALLHEIGHIQQVERLGKIIFGLHTLRYLVRFGYKNSKIEKGADMYRDRLFEQWTLNGQPDRIHTWGTF